MLVRLWFADTPSGRESAMEQGPDELGERPDDRAEELKEQTDKPMDEGPAKESKEDTESQG